MTSSTDSIVPRIAPIAPIATQRKDQPVLDILATTEALLDPGSVVEVRALGVPGKGVISGYFTDYVTLAWDAVTFSGKAESVLLSLNEVNPALLGRSANRLKPFAKHTTSDADIVRRRWLLVDVDPVRPSGISSTDSEHTAALERAEHIREYLSAQGWPEPIVADSGNGAHLLYRLDLPNDKATSDLLRRVLEAIGFQQDDDVVQVDKATYNPARLVKLYGTKSCKGSDLPERPHRFSRLLSVPEKPVPVSLELLESLAASLPRPEPKPPSRPGASRTEGFDLDRWIAATGLVVVSSGPWQGGRRLILNPCPWNPDHTNRAAYIVQHASGAIAAGCLHNGCRDKSWHALRDIVEPGWRDRQEASGIAPGGRTGHAQTSEPSRKAVPPASESWPSSLAEEAYHGLAGAVLRAISPHTEADPAAILLQFLTGFGNLIGRRPYFEVEASKHFSNLFCCLVGSTSKGRKGTSWGHVRSLLERVEQGWTAERVRSGLSSGEGLIFAVRDDGEEDRRLLALEPEFATVLRAAEREGCTVSGRLREAWDSGNLGTLTRKDPLKATGAHVSVIGHVVRDEVRRYLRDSEKASGFGNRILWTCVRRSQLLPEGGNLTANDLNPLVEQLREAVTFARKTDQVRRDDEAREIWREAYAKLSDDVPGLLGAITSRAEAQVVRLSLLYALLDCSPVIRSEHLLAALAVWDYCSASARYIFGDASGDVVADEILTTLRAAGEDGLTRTDLRDLFKRNQSARRISDALETLRAAGLARVGKRETEGRSAEVWWAQ